MTLLEVDAISVRYGHAEAVRDVSLELSEGEFVGVVGPNGAGKTTVLNAIAGVVKPVAGRIRFGGADVTGRRPEELLASGISLVPENRRIFTTLTVAENLHLGATVRKDRAGVQEDIERALELFPVLRRYFGKLAGLLSGGEQQQLAIARALLSKPRVLVLDEPSLGLAPKIVDLVFDVLTRLREEGMTILLVEQSVKRTVELADRTYVLRSGAVVTVGTRDEMSGADLSHAYFGSP